MTFNPAWTVTVLKRTGQHLLLKLRAVNTSLLAMVLIEGVRLPSRCKITLALFTTAESEQRNRSKAIAL